MEVRELLSSYDFPGDDIPIIRGSARMALESTSKDINAPEYAPILELMDAVDSYIPTPDRQADKPFPMPVEDVFSISGRGTVATGRVERGTLKVNDTVEIVGPTDEKVTTVVTGVEMFHKLLPELRLVTTSALCSAVLRRTALREVRFWRSPAPCTPTPTSRVMCTSLSEKEGGCSKPFVAGYRPQSLLPHHRRYRHHRAARGRRDVPPRRQRRYDRYPRSPPVACEVGLRFAIREGSVPSVPASSPRFRLTPDSLTPALRLLAAARGWTSPAANPAAGDIFRGTP